MNAWKLAATICLGFILSWLIDSAFADGKTMRCELRAHYVVAGALARKQNMPRELKWVTIEEQIAISAANKNWKDGDTWPLPYNLIRDDGEPDGLKALIGDAYRDGWDVGAKHPEFDPHAMRKPAFDVCMREVES